MKRLIYEIGLVALLSGVSFNCKTIKPKLEIPETQSFQLETGICECPRYKKCVEEYMGYNRALQKMTLDLAKVYCNQECREKCTKEEHK